MAWSNSREECTAITQLFIVPQFERDSPKFLAITFRRYTHILIVPVSVGNGLLNILLGSLP